MKKASAILALAALAAACASAPKLAPKAGPEQVQLFDPEVGQFPEPGYKTIGPVKARVPLGTPQAELLLALRAEAAKLGADAVVVQKIRRSTEGETGLSMEREEMMIAEGLAIYWPAPSQPKP
ncbi:MAG: hypothetical protein HY561_09865 [Gemmatimonadetes bacterium]|nr:hypothetical protein [Gemmatimonadota bacterium]